ncbi:hypothetical protein HC928_02930 [bacterium]|nr:hypothetical protein [bacterium]
MSEKKISLRFTAVDAASNVINGINGKLNQVAQSGGVVNKALDGVMLGAGMQAFNAALGLVSSSVDYLKNRFLEAGKAQTEMIGNTGALGAAMEKPMKDATVVMDQLTASVNKNLAALPGATEGYMQLATGLIDNFVPAAKDAMGALDPKKLVDLTTQFSGLYGVLAQGRGIDTVLASQGINKALSGTSVGELRQQAIFDSGLGAKVLQEVTDKLTAAGKDLKTIKVEERIKLFKDAAEKFISPEVMQAYMASFEGSIASIETAVGMFTNFNTKLAGRGNQTVLNAAGETLNAIYEMFSEIGSLLGINSEGFQTAIFDGLKATTEIINRSSDFINQMILGFQNNDLLGSLTMIEEQFRGLGESLGVGFNQWMNSIDWLALLIIIGEVALKALTAIGALLGGWLGTVIPGTAERSINALSNMFNTLVYGLTGMAMSVGEGIKRIVSDLSTKIMETLAGPLDALSTAFNGMLSVIQWITDRFNQLKALVPGQGGNEQPQAAYSYSNVSSNHNFNQVNNINISGDLGNSRVLSQDIISVLDTRWNEYKYQFA